MIGSVYASLYLAAFKPDVTGGLPPQAVDRAQDSIGAALVTAGRLGADGSQLQAVAASGFFDGLQAGCLVAAGVCAAGALFSAIVLPAQPEAEPAEERPAAGEPAVAGARA